MNLQTLRRVGMLALVGIALAGLVGGVMAQNNNAPLHSKPSENTRPVAQAPNPSVDEKLVNANTKFGFQLFSEIIQQGGSENVFISPTSVAIALAMTYNGASSETQQEMAQALEFQGMTLSEINQANEALKTSLENADPEVQLSIANSLWARQEISFNPEFLQRNQDFYGARVEELDFTNPNAPGIINNWVEENTNGRIEQIINEIQPEAILFLINAIYFKGNWAEQFDENLTTEQPFYLPDGSEKPHPLMSQSGRYLYLENEDFQGISLPYGDGRLSLYVFLPREASSLAEFQKQLTFENWQQWTSQFQRREGLIKLPRFKFEYEIQLNEALKALGMETAFDANKANFSNMTDTPAKIDEVKHKTFVEVNEEGTEAAAVTSVGVVATSARMPETPFQMTVNRPFWCAIRDNQTGTVLFMGSIVNPQ
jgi:serpin B